MGSTIESMFLEIAPNGSKYWRLAYRFGGKQKLLAIGVYPKMSIKEARKARRIAKELIAGGTDPTQQKKLDKQIDTIAMDNSFSAVAHQWLKVKQHSWAPAYHQKAQKLLERNLFPWLGDRPITQITPPELLSVLRRAEAAGKLETARRAKQIAGHVFRYAVGGGYAERDPSQDLKDQLATPKCVHFASITEPKEVGKLLRAMDQFDGTPEVRAALLISPLLFQRPGEIRQMLWADIDFEKAEWRYTVTKTNMQHVAPLSKQAMQILEEIRPITCTNGRAYNRTAHLPARKEMMQAWADYLDQLKQNNSPVPA